MSQLKTHNVSELGAFQAEKIHPGTFVTHLRYNGSFGVCLARRWEAEPVGSRFEVEKCDVLWSTGRLPDINIQVQEIKAESRKLRARWSVEVWEDETSFLKVDRFTKTHDFTGKVEEP
jgi:hypothetical protein